LAQLTKPDGEFTTEIELLMTAHSLWIASEKKWIPDPEMIAKLPIGYIPDILRLETLIRFYRDSSVVGWG